MTTMIKSPKNQTLQSRIDRVEKSIGNLQNAKNPAQREAAEKFLTMRMTEMDHESKELEAWLHEADEYINTEMPQINADAGHEHNREWVRKLGEYQAMRDAVDAAWEALMAGMEAA